MQSKFEAELDATQRQQLGKKRKRVGVKQRRKRLDPALQASYCFIFIPSLIIFIYTFVHFTLRVMEIIFISMQGLMGEANLRFVRGDRDTAVRMCMEVIRQVSYQLS